MALSKIGVENITVSTSVVSLTPTNGEVLLAIIHHRSGGNIYQNTNSDPTAGGAAGDHPQYLEDIWKVWGYDNINNHRMIKLTSESDAVVAVQYYGTKAATPR